MSEPQPRARILVAMPCAHGMAHAAAMTTLAEACLGLHGAGCSIAIGIDAPSDLVISRNLSASLALDGGFTHLLFIDSDMQFPRELVLRMLHADRDVIGLIYTRRAVDVEQLIELSRAEPQKPGRQAVAKSYEYVVLRKPGEPFIRGLGRVFGVGMGGTLIKTTALKRLVDEERVVLHPPLREEHPPLWGFFDLTTTEDGIKLSEDYSFCERWARAGGAVWGLATDQVRHVGDFDYGGDPLAALAGSTYIDLQGEAQPSEA